MANQHAPTITRIRAVGLGLLRYGLAFLLVMIGSFKFLAFEAEGIRPLTTTLRVLMATGQAVGLNIGIYNPAFDKDGAIARGLVSCLVAGLS